MKVATRLFVVASLLVVLAGLSRAEQPVQLALFAPDLQLVNEDESIRGLRLNIYGRNKEMIGLDLGFVHETKENFGGVSLGLGSMVGADMYGLQWSWIYSRTTGAIHGWSSGILTRAGKGSRGIQTAVVALNDADFTGVQLSCIYNDVQDKLTGVQIGLVNHAIDARGVQIGIANFADNINGVQIGIWNQIHSKENWNVIPIVNWKF